MNALLPDTISMFVGYSFGSFVFGWGIATLIKTFKQFGEKI